MKVKKNNNKRKKKKSTILRKTLAHFESPPIYERDPETLELVPDPEWALHPFSGTMATDLEVLIVIPTTLHSAVNVSSASGRSPFLENMHPAYPIYAYIKVLEQQSSHTDDIFCIFQQYDVKLHPAQTSL